MNPSMPVRRQMRCLLLLLLMSALASSCSVVRETPSARRMSDDEVRRYSQRLGVPLTGTEDPALIREVTEWIGVPYRYGGTTRSGADCSGFIQAVYRNAYGKEIPRTTEQQARSARPVRPRHMRTGDLVFFHIKRRKISHAGIYLGQGYFVHASSSRGVIVSSLDEDYYSRRFARGGRMQ